MAAPLPLIYLEGDKFVIGKEAAENLRNITHDIAVVSIAGLYRTGKSYLLNRLLGRQDGFGVGPTVSTLLAQLVLTFVDKSLHERFVFHIVVHWPLPFHPTSAPRILLIVVGIFLWGEPIINHDSNIAILLVDTEGTCPYSKLPTIHRHWLDSTGRKL